MTIHPIGAEVKSRSGLPNAGVRSLLGVLETRRAYSQRRLYRLFRALDILRSPRIKDIFSRRLVRGGFPHLERRVDDVDPVSEPESEFGLFNDLTADRRLAEDGYQQIMKWSRAEGLVCTYTRILVHA